MAISENLTLLIGEINGKMDIVLNRLTRGDDKMDEMQRQIDCIKDELKARPCMSSHSTCGKGDGDSQSFNWRNSKTMWAGAATMLAGIAYTIFEALKNIMAGSKPGIGH